MLSDKRLVTSWLGVAWDNNSGRTAVCLTMSDNPFDMDGSSLVQCFDVLGNRPLKPIPAEVLVSLFVRFNRFDVSEPLPWDLEDELAPRGIIWG